MTETAGEFAGHGALTPEGIDELRQEFTLSAHNRLMQNALSRQPVTEIAMDRDVVTSTDHVVSHQVVRHKVANQKKSGRCWMFAGLNLLRTGIAETLGVKDFELSQNYLLYWDKLEKANYFLESVIATTDRDVDDRTVAHLLDTPTEDGGQWNMFAALVRKHGLVPLSAMPETESSSNTHRMNSVLAQVLRKAARDLRAQDDVAVVQKVKRAALADAHRLLTMHLGTPPESFLWQWEDDDHTFHRDGMLRPQEFATRYVTIDLDDYVCLVHDPRPTSEEGRTYTVDFLGNVVGGEPVTYLNASIEVVRQATADTLLDGEPVWFGCDTGKMSNSDIGLWDRRLYDFDAVYATDLSMPKADRLLHHDTLMTHAMMFIGVDIVDDRPRKWLVENSWGTDKGKDGLFVMNDNWFAEHVFEVAVRRDRLPDALQAALGSEPIVLPAWDPMGALA